MKKDYYNLLKAIKNSGIKFKLFLAIIISNIFLLISIEMGQTSPQNENSSVDSPPSDHTRYQLPIKTYLPQNGAEKKVLITLTNQEGHIISKRAILYLLPTLDETENTYLYPVDIPLSDSPQIIKTTHQYFLAYPYSSTKIYKKEKDYEIIF